MRLDVGKKTDVGRVRESNEDSLLVLGPEHGLPADEWVVAVADGMGGHNAGEVASDLAVRAIEDALKAAERATPGAGGGPPSGARVRRAVVLANASVWSAAQAERANEGMGTTLVCALVSGSGQTTIANVGDSRAYLVSGQDARLITTDHSWVIDQVRAGRMSEAEAEQSPYKHILSRSLGVTPDVDVDVYEVGLREGEALVLCSDGVSNHLSSQDIGPIVAGAASAQEAAERLVQKALERGGSDNATVVVVRAMR